MFVCQVFTWFVIYSVVGWIWESAYCTVVERRWQNRGFLYGPVCPIYGTGIVGIMLLWHHLLARGLHATWYQVFLVTMVGSAVLEYVTHWALEKLFHAYWWDYSNMPLNLNGRICLPASTFFGLGGLLVVYVLYDPTLKIVASANPLLCEALSLLLMAAMAADTAVTASSLTAIARTAASINQSANAHMDQLVARMEERGAKVAHDVAEGREQTAEALASAAAVVQRRQDEALEQFEQHRAATAEARAKERERFARELRTRRLAEMGVATRLAARRAYAAVSPERLPDTPQREQLAKLWRDMLEQH